MQGDQRDLDARPQSLYAGPPARYSRTAANPSSPWPDVVQLNAFSPAMRAATAETLASIAEQCDGIRCDMAMLMTNNIFAQDLGGPREYAKPTQEFWPEVIGALRTRHPDTVLVAEAYWDMEWQLQQQGFDFCYDKRLYDRITGADATAVRGIRRRRRPELPVPPVALPGEPRRTSASPSRLQGDARAGSGHRPRDAARRNPVA